MQRPTMPRWTLSALALTLAGCSITPEEPVGPPAKEMLYAVTASNRLVSFNGGQPQKLLTDGLPRHRRRAGRTAFTRSAAAPARC